MVDSFVGFDLIAGRSPQMVQWGNQIKHALSHSDEINSLNKISKAVLICTSMRLHCCICKFNFWLPYSFIKYAFP